MKKKGNVFMKLLAVSFVIFLGLYIASISGYYEARVGEKVALTNDAIKQFEQDVLEGKVVDLNTYIEEDTVDYSNKFTNAGERFGEAIEKFVTDGIGGAWDAIKILFF